MQNCNFTLCTQFYIPSTIKTGNYTLAYTIDTGKTLSEALIFASTIPQYDIRLFIELRVQYKLYSRCGHVVRDFESEEKTK